MKYIATISGGKDSVTMCDLLLKNNYPVDYIVFNDTLDEFDEMYVYLDKVEAYFKRRYGKEIVRTKPIRTYDDYIFHTLSKGDREGMISGLPCASAGFCTWRRDAKVVPFERWAKQIGEHKIYMGITLDETHRCDRSKNFLYPLIDDFKMSENDCKKYLIDQDMENPLYRHFNRTGCKKCQYQSDRDWYMIYKHYPKVWAEMQDYELHVLAMENVVNKFWFTNFRTCADMEKLFKKTEKQGTLFDLSDEPLKDCFCKISFTALSLLPLQGLLNAI